MTPSEPQLIEFVGRSGLDLQTISPALINLTTALHHAPDTPGSTVLERAVELLDEAEQIIAAHRGRIAELERLSTTDELTGALNRRGFMEQLRLQIAGARRYGHTGVLALCDLDDLKRINDGFGHKAGDAALIRLFSFLKEQVRETDLIGRLGGDEFAIALTCSDAPGGLQRIEALSTLLDSGVAMCDITGLPALASFGAVPYSGQETPDALLQTADQQLYAAKRRRKTLRLSAGTNDR